MILTNCRLIPELCEGFEEERADIRVEGKKIAEILPAGGTYTGEEVYDMAGKTVLPGLFNCHEHLYFAKNKFDFLHSFTPYEHLSHSINYGQQLLSYGFTTVKDCGSINDTATQLRDLVKEGVVQGPNILSSGPSFSPFFENQKLLDIYSSVDIEGHRTPVTSVDMIKAAVEERFAKGADFIKLCGSSAKKKIKKPEDALGQCLFSLEEVQAFVDNCARLGSYVTMHSTCAESHEIAIEAGVHTLDHGIYLSQENVDKMKAKGVTNLVPTLAVSYVGFKEGWPTYDVCHPGAGNGMRMAHDAGICVGFGTDDFQKDFLKFPAVEWVARSEFGISNLDLLKQATINSAKICLCDKKYGSIKVGKIADLAVIDGNPDEDLLVFNNPCAFVFKNGKLVARDGIVYSTGVNYKF